MVDHCTTSSSKAVADLVCRSGARVPRRGGPVQSRSVSFNALRFRETPIEPCYYQALVRSLPARKASSPAYQIDERGTEGGYRILTRLPHDSGTSRPLYPSLSFILTHIQMKFLAIEDHSMAVSKPPILALFTNIGSDSLQSTTWHVDAVFSPNELLVDVLTCTKVLADAQGGVTVPCAYGMPQVLMPAASLRQGGMVCPSIATGTRAKSAGLPGMRVTWAAIMIMASSLFLVLYRGRWM